MEKCFVDYMILALSLALHCVDGRSYFNVFGMDGRISWMEWNNTWG